MDAATRTDEADFGVRGRGGCGRPLDVHRACCAKLGARGACGLVTGGIIGSQK